MQILLLHPNSHTCVNDTTTKSLVQISALTRKVVVWCDVTVDRLQGCGEEQLLLVSALEKCPLYQLSY